MGYFSIVNKEERKGEIEKPYFFQDLNLDGVIERIEDLWGAEVREFFYDIPIEKDNEAYRREIYRDLKEEKVYSVMDAFRQHMNIRNEMILQKEAVEAEIQKHIWQIREVCVYVEAVEKLLAGLEGVVLTSRGLVTLRTLLKEYAQKESFRTMAEKGKELREKLQSFRIQLTYEKDRFSVSEGTCCAEYEDFLEGCFPGHDTFFKNPFLSQPDLTELEMEVVKIFRKKHGAFFKEAAEFYSTYQEYAREEILRLHKESSYYMAFRFFQRRMEDRGLEFATPTVEEEKEMRADRLYDLALALVCMEDNRKVISNDMFFAKEESFFVLTGPNQGGKTTFARSLGQLVYFTKMGLDVPAFSANVPFFKSIMTHFSVEESAESGRGKLMEELERLGPMMKEHSPDAFVVINELFTTAANYDACIMGKKVLEHFVEEGCRGIYVTHLTPLTKAHERIVSLRATLNEEKKQTFRIERSEASEEAGASIQVKKYRLTYEQIKERLS